MEGISIQYPVWYLIFCFLVGGGYALGLYLRDKSFREQSRWLNLLLGAFRMLVVGTLVFLLLSPFIKTFLEEYQKPLVIFAQDNSTSVGQQMTADEKVAYLSSIAGLQTELQENYELVSLSFGNETREIDTFNFEDKITNISQALQTIEGAYSNQNLGAVILATDGIYNEGRNPIYNQSNLDIPIYTIALGDTTPQRDLLIRRVYHNKIAYLGDRFTVQVDVSGLNLLGEKSALNVYKITNSEPQLLQTIGFEVDRNEFFLTQEFIVEANESGVQRFRIEVAPVSGESSSRNNRRDIFIDVLDARQQLLILAAVPHPDVTAIRQSLVENKNYEVKVAFVDDFTENVAKYDFVILHQVPSYSNSAEDILREIRDRGIPRLFIVGEQSQTNLLNNWQGLVELAVSQTSTNQVQGIIEPLFNSFTISNELTQEIPQFVPVQTPFGEFTLGEQARVFMYQRIGKVDTKYPLWVFGEEQNVRVSILLAEGVWRWRLYDFLQHQNHELFDEMLGKSVQYLSVKEDKRKFRVSLDKAIYNDSEELIFDAQLYNDNYELVNDPDVSLSINAPAGNQYDFIFNKTSEAYALNAGVFPAGNYQYEANVLFNGEKLNYQGEFSVEPVQIEQYEQRADHRTLQLLSQSFGGRVFYPDQIGEITDFIASNNNLKPILYQTTKTQPFINLKWIFILLLALLVLEWFFRRYFGSY